MKTGVPFFLACLVALAGSAIGLMLLAGGWHPFAWSAGGLLAMVNSLIGDRINRRAIGTDSTGFLLWGLGAHLLRVMILLVVLGLAHRFDCPESGALIRCTLFGYFTFLFHEVLGLHFQSMSANLTGSFATRV